MKKFNVLFVFLFLTTILLAQSSVVESFEDPQDISYWIPGHAYSSDPELAFTNLTFQNTTAQVDNALKVDWGTQNSEGWGGYANFAHLAPEWEVFDFSDYDSISFWVYTETPSTLPGRVHFRFNLWDVSEVDDSTTNINQCEYYYSFHYAVVDAAPGWQQIKMPLEADPNFWSGEGFNRTGWVGISGNNTLDLDQIKGFTLEFSMSGSGEGDFASGTVIFDQVEIFGAAPKPWLIFNGKVVDLTFSQFSWGQSQLAVVEGAGEDPALNALLWTQGNEWGNGWSGAGWNIVPSHNLAFRWALDSLKLKMKVEEGVNSPIRFQFESGGDGKVSYLKDVIADNQWHEYSIALADFTNEDGTTNFNPASISVFQMIGQANAVAGKKIYFEHIWTGDPDIDVIAPAAPQGLAVIEGSYQNLVTWIDVPGEEGEIYSVYYSFNPITDLNAPNLEVVSLKVNGGEQIVTHVLRAPSIDKELTYFYAITCMDAAGNLSDISASGAITNTAEGVPPIHPEMPTGFVADGNLSEWSSLMNFRMFPSDGSGTIVNNTSIDGDADLSVLAWVAMDENYIYFAADVEDDVISTDTMIASYLQDSPDLFIGLYDAHGASHTSYQGGTEPDVHIRFNVNQIWLDNGGVSLARLGENYNWTNTFPTGYKVEGKISLDALGEISNWHRFNPAIGNRIPIEFCINDADATGQREGILTYSVNNQDQAYQDVARWSYTWIGDEMVGTTEIPSETPTEYVLNQNYPNPFNPSTTINYFIPNSGLTTIKIYNLLGQEVMTLVNQVQNSGSYSVTFDASHLTSGVYMYQLQSGNASITKKMMLLK